MDPSKYPPWPGDDKSSVLLDIVAKQNIDEVFKLCYLRRDMHEESIKVTGKNNFASTDWLPTIEQALSAKHIPGPRSDAPDIPPLGSASISTYSGQAMGQKFTGVDTMRIVEAIPGEKYTIELYVATTAPYGDKFKTIVKQSLVALPPDNHGKENTGSTANSSSSPTSSSNNNNNTVTASNTTTATTNNNSNRTQYRVLVAPVFTSKVNGFIKGMIEKGVKDGTTRNFTDLATAMAKFIEIERPEDAATAAAKRRKQASVETVTAAQHVAAQAQELLPFLDHFHPEVLFGSKSYAILLQWSVYLSQHEIGFDQRTNLFGLSLTSAYCIVYVTLQLLLLGQTLLRQVDAMIDQIEWVTPVVYLVRTPIESMLSIIKLPENMSQLMCALFICIALKHFSNKYLIGLLPPPPAVPQPSDHESAAAVAAGRGGIAADGSNLLLGDADGQGIRYEGYNETMATVAAKLHKGANDFQMGAQGFKGALHAVRVPPKQQGKSRRYHGRSGSGDGVGGSTSRHYGNQRNTSKERTGAPLPPTSSTYNEARGAAREEGGGGGGGGGGGTAATPTPPSRSRQPTAAAAAAAPSSSAGDPVATIRDSIANFTQSIRDPFISHTTDHMKKKVKKGLKKQQQPMHKRTSSKGSLTPEPERCTSPMSDVDAGAFSDGDAPHSVNDNKNGNDGRKKTVSFAAFSSQLLTKKLRDARNSRREHGPSSSFGGGGGGISLPQLDSDGEEVVGSGSDREGTPSSSNDHIQSTTANTGSRITSMHSSNRAATNSPSHSTAAGGRSEHGEEEEVSSNSRHYINDNRTTTDAQGQLRMEGAVVEEVFENQRLQPFRGWGSTWPGHFLPTDKVSKYSSSSSYNSQSAAALGDGVTIGIKTNIGSMKVSQKFKQVAPSLPQGWAWVDPAWKVDISGLLTEESVDQHGWSYALDFSRLSYPYLEGSGSKAFSDFVRQRRFIRTRAPIVVGGRGEGKSTQQQQATTVLVGSLTETIDPGRAMSMLSDALALELGKTPQDVGVEEEDDANDDESGGEMKVDADFNHNNNTKTSSSGSSCESPLQHLSFGDDREEDEDESDDGGDRTEGGYTSDNEEEEEEEEEGGMRRDGSGGDVIEREGGESG